VSYPTPVNRKQLQSFLWLAGYCRKFIPHYSYIKKGTRFVWTPVADRAFPDLKSRLSTPSVLWPPYYSLRYCVPVGASDVATGLVLFQTVEGTDRLELDSHRCNYSTIEKEAPSLVLSVCVFSVYFSVLWIQPSQSLHGPQSTYLSWASFLVVGLYCDRCD